MSRAEVSAYADAAVSSVHAMLKWTRVQLGAQAESSDAEIVSQAGRQKTRHYHTLEHFEMVAGAWQEYPQLGLFSQALKYKDPQTFSVIKALMQRAGAHHDVVYLDADQGRLPPAMAAYLQHFVRTDAAGGVLATCDVLPDVATDDERMVLAWAQAIFRKSENQKLGTNEYLSAVYAALQGLSEGISPAYILAEITMIAGTIPFQPADYMDELFQRLQQVHGQLSEQDRLTDDMLHDVMIAAVQVANCDVLGFSTTQLQKFLMETQQLLLEESAGEEISPVACEKKVYFLHELLQQLPLEKSIFHGFRGFPSDANLQALHAHAKTILSECIDAIRTGFK
jgi:hypothetical protein